MLEMTKDEIELEIEQMQPRYGYLAQKIVEIKDGHEGLTANMLDLMEIITIHKKKCAEIEDPELREKVSADLVNCIKILEVCGREGLKRQESRLKEELQDRLLADFMVLKDGAEVLKNEFPGLEAHM